MAYGKTVVFCMLALAHVVLGHGGPHVTNFQVIIDPQGMMSGLGQVRSYHVSCRSKFNTHSNLIGIVLYGKGNSQQWQHNGMKFKSGYIYITDDSAARDFPRETGLVHGAAYRRLTGASKPDDVTASGFSIQHGVWKFNSYSMNTHGKFTNNIKAMRDHEQGWVKAAVEQWLRSGKQNYYL